MFCQTLHCQTSPQNIDEVARIFRETAFPLASRQPGFVATYLVAKPDGRFMLFMVWDTQAHAEAWRQSPEHEKGAAQVRPLLNGNRVLESYEVRAHQVGRS